MPEVDRKIRSFLGRHHLLTISVVSGDGPWCASCFYAYSESDNAFVVSSASETRHGQAMAENPHVALSVALETRMVGKIQGIQVEAVARRADERDRSIYLGKFPYAAVVPDLELWHIEPRMMKFTDNTLGFGRKLIWRAQQE